MDLFLQQTEYTHHHSTGEVLMYLLFQHVMYRVKEKHLSEFIKEEQVGREKEQIKKIKLPDLQRPSV